MKWISETVCLSSSQWRTWSVMMVLYRSLTSCPRPSWRSWTNQTKHKKRAKGATEGPLTSSGHDAAQTDGSFVRLADVFMCIFKKTQTLLSLHLVLNKFTKMITCWFCTFKNFSVLPFMCTCSFDWARESNVKVNFFMWHHFYNRCSYICCKNIVSLLTALLTPLCINATFLLRKLYS